MDFPQDISNNPDIIYYADMGIFNLAFQNQNYVIGIPRLGTSVGLIVPETFSRQFRKAYDDYPSLVSSPIVNNSEEYILKRHMTI